ncbi:hypothetical protein CPB83DRAFT_821291 [Crepidotus variabilis]|uniref:B-block binding subunit of TFIIIC domain-containing protein n=1 Tax=Crepidotus variabilis TaxID=179855 RepID=A0A9P6E6M4_9AGAR|nr:hypothetical protein CPB83DRAFT_821291 [Crepidotus variabilis]
MDELLHHCLRELAFDGDLGCSTSRLRDFIHNFYAHKQALHVQNLDDSFCACVWSLLVQQPTVSVGLIPKGVTTDVWIAPPPSAKRKGQQVAPQQLELLHDWKSKPLPLLVEQYGENLRMAAEPNTIFAAITGSHVRSPRMSPMVYSILQIVTRGRDAGVSVVDLGKISGYDQKSCFYLVKQLTDMDMVLKVRRGGVGSHFVIHKYFYERSSVWKAIRDEENEAESSRIKNDPDDSDSEDDAVAVAESQALNFTTIDARHLSSFTIIRSRVIKLLKASANHMHTSKNMIVTLGFPRPTKTDRRFFNSRMNEMVQKGMVEKVLVPNPTKGGRSDGPIKCYRLAEPSETVAQEITTPQIEENYEEEDVLEGFHGRILVNSAIPKQIIDLVEQSGTNGLTLLEIVASLNGFDRRMLEELLARCEKAVPPPHLLDLHIVGIMENKGRERRQKYYTAQNYRKLVTNEGLDEEGVLGAFDLDKAGGFTELTHNAFYEDEEGLEAFYESLPRVDELPKANNKAYKNPILPDGSIKRGRPRKGSERPKKVRKNPVLPDGTVKKGRPKKHPTLDGEVGAANTTSRRAAKRKRAEEEDTVDQAEGLSTKKMRVADDQPDGPPPTKKKRGRPPRDKPTNIIIPDKLTSRMQVYVEILSPRRLSEQEHPDSSQTEFQVEEIPNIVDNPPDPHTEERPLDTVAQVDQPSVVATPSVQEEAGVEEIPASPTSTRQSQSPPKSPTRNTPLSNSPTTPITTATSGRVNVSHLRRENEFLRLLEMAGGIVGTHSKEIFEEHMKLLEELSKAGEPTSAPPGTRTDKRTLMLTFESMERKGKVKLLKTSITLPTGLNKAASLVYLPDVEEIRIHQFLEVFSQSSYHHLPQLTSFTRLEESTEYGSIPRNGASTIRFLQAQTSQQRHEEPQKTSEEPKKRMASTIDEEIRSAFLADRSTTQQLYGYILGRALRGRQLHLGLLQALESEPTSSNIVSCEKRIVEMSYLLFDLPVKLYCSIVAPSEYNEELLAILSDEIKNQMPVCALPSRMHTLLVMGKARARSRFLEVLEILQALHIITALRPTTSDQPFVTCISKGRHPTRYEVTSIEGSTQTSTAPSYWMFNEAAPIYLWAVSEANPPLWRNASLATLQEARLFWKDLQYACTESNIDLSHLVDDLTEAAVAGLELGKFLRRDASWKTDYRFSENQIRYLRQAIDTASRAVSYGDDEAEKNLLLERLSWIVCAPRHCVEHMLASLEQKNTSDIEKLKRRRKRAEESRAVLARKAEEARIQRESDWTILLAKVHPEQMPSPAAIRIDRVRKQYLKAGSVMDEAKWVKEIQAALHETDLASTRGLKISSRPVLRSLNETAPVSQTQTSTSEPSVYDLIEKQGPPIDHDSVLRRKRTKETEGRPQGPKKRRHRFQWNNEFDELARDASVIIRSRCRNLSRLDWAAFEQVFPAVPRNTVRQRLTHIKGTPGNEAYTRRLEDVWYSLWTKYRGTTELPDLDLQSPSNFDLIKHVQFLRSHVDKHALRVGISHNPEKEIAPLPSSVEQLKTQFKVVGRERTAPEYEWMWNTLVEEGREKKLKHQPFSRYYGGLPNIPPLNCEELAVAESAVKMVMGAPPERYNSEIAASLLKSLGHEPVSAATKGLLTRGVLSKLQRDPKKPRPGRTLKISDNNQNALGGSIEQDTFQDALLLLEEMDFGDDSWREWPLAATDGDCAALISLTSNGQVEFSVDTTTAQAARPALDWNSKKADDDQMETVIKVRYHLSQDVDQPQMEEEPSYQLKSVEGHGFKEDGQEACCRMMVPAGPIDCSTCLEGARRALLELTLLEDEARFLAGKILQLTDQAKEKGVKKSDLVVSCLPNVLEKMIASSIPLVFWAGYENLVLVSARYTANWTVVTAQDPLTRIFPRRWFDLHGQRIADFWQAAVRAVISAVVFRPGIPQVRLYRTLFSWDLIVFS